MQITHKQMMNVFLSNRLRMLEIAAFSLRLHLHDQGKYILLGIGIVWYDNCSLLLMC